MKILITVLLSAALLSLPGTPVNNSETTVAHTAKTEQRVTTQEPEITVAVAEHPHAPQPESQPEPVAIPEPPLNSHEALMSQAGIDQNDWAAVDYIVTHESSWRSSATEPHTGAYGLCQSLPAVKMASAGSDWQTNPVTQLKWCDSYAQARYGGWHGAYAHWTAFRWW